MFSHLGDDCVSRSTALSAVKISMVPTRVKRIINVVYCNK